ncbi:UNVERIFIED_CONTAM: hypothetical protein GTU68_052532 [Idotea baltica]|nr:hypothetical protein [Idotea baltica]
MLAIYRLGVFVSTPGVDVAALRAMFDTSAGTIFGMVNMFSGGSLERFSIFTLGIMPYISVSIIIQFLTPAIPALEALKKEGASGQRIITRYTRQGTIALALFQSFLIAKGLQASPGLVLNPGWSFVISTMITLTAGTAFIMWLSEQITERGIGNGMSIIIFAGIIARMPSAFISTLALAREGQIQPITILILIAFSIATIAAIVFVERSMRKIPVQYPRRMSGADKQMGIPQFMPLKVNMAGVLPPIFAYAIIVIPGTVAGFNSNETLQDVVAWISPGEPLYYILLVALIFVCAFYCTAVIYNPVEVADNLKKNGAFIPTVRPGKDTADYLYAVTTRLTVWGGIYIALVCIIPEMFYLNMGVSSFSYVFGGTAILIAVGVTLDTLSQIESHIVSRNYESFMSKGSGSKGPGGSMRMRTKVLKR